MNYNLIFFTVINIIIILAFMFIVFKLEKENNDLKDEIKYLSEIIDTLDNE